MEAIIYDAISDSDTANISLGGIEHIQIEHDGSVKIYFSSDWRLEIQADEVSHIQDVLKENADGK